MDKLVRVKLIDDAEIEFKELNKVVGEEKVRGIENSDSQQLLNSIERAVSLLKDNPFFGIQMKKALIPPHYEVDNLWKVNLTGYWRLLYTIRGGEAEIICFVLEICDHDKYDKIFSYKG